MDGGSISSNVLLRGCIDPVDIEAIDVIDVLRE